MIQPFDEMLQTNVTVQHAVHKEQSNIFAQHHTDPHMLAMATGSTLYQSKYFCSTDMEIMECNQWLELS